jgi:Glycosyltransferase family 87
MPLPRRPTLVLLAVVALSWSTAPSGGMYSPMAVALALAALGLALAACLLPDRPWQAPADVGTTVIRRALLLLAVLGGFHCVWKGDAVAAVVAAGALLLLAVLYRRPPRPAAPFEASLVAAALLLSGTGVFTAEVLYGEEGVRRTPLMIAAAATGFVLSATWLLDLGTPTRVNRVFWPRLLLAFAAAGLLRVSAVLASPEPVIDVYAWLRDAPAFLLRGENPYSAAYASPYGTERAARYNVSMTPDPHPAVYPPLPILMAVPFSAAGLDVRYANVCCDLLAGAVLLAAGWARAGPRVGAILAGIYLFLPRVPFLIEHAWYEPMLAALLGGGLLLAGRGRWAGYLLLGLGLTGKQFGLPLLLPLARAQWRHWPALLLGIVAAGLLVVPFFLWDPAAFLDIVLFKHLGRPAMFDSITLASGAHNLLGLDLPRPLLLGAAVLLIAWVTWKTPERIPAAALWMGAALLTFCLLHTQGYFNYFYLCQFLMLLGIADLIPEGEPMKPAEEAAPERGARL